MTQLEVRNAAEQATENIATCIAGPAGIYSAAKSLKAYMIVAERLSIAEVAMDVGSQLTSVAAIGALSYNCEQDIHGSGRRTATHA